MQIRVIDLTREIHDGTESYPGDRVGIRIEHLATVKTNGHSLSRITWLDCHCGTNIDTLFTSWMAAAPVRAVGLVFQSREGEPRC